MNPHLRVEVPSQQTGLMVWEAEVGISPGRELVSNADTESTMQRGTEKAQKTTRK